MPGARRRATGSYELSSGDPTGVPTTSWLFDGVPAIDSTSWRLEVAAGEDVTTLTMTDIDALHDQVTAVLDCTGGWYTEQTWTGARVARLLPPGTTGTVTVISATGYRRRLPLTDDLLLATGFGGRKLSPGHGAPLRLVVPGGRGFHWSSGSSASSTTTIPGGGSRRSPCSDPAVAVEGQAGVSSARSCMNRNSPGRPTSSW